MNLPGEVDRTGSIESHEVSDQHHSPGKEQQEQQQQRRRRRRRYRWQSAEKTESAVRAEAVEELPDVSDGVARAWAWRSMAASFSVKTATALHTQRGASAGRQQLAPCCGSY